MSFATAVDNHFSQRPCVALEGEITMERARELMALGNKAQDARLSMIANLVFCLLLEMRYKGSEHAYLKIAVLTDDTTGRKQNKLKHDLVVIEIAGEESGLSIPARILKSRIALGCYKAAAAQNGVREKTGRARETHEATQEETNTLWHELSKLAWWADLRDVAIMFLPLQGGKLDQFNQEMTAHYRFESKD